MPRRKTSNSVARRRQANSFARLRKLGITKSTAGTTGKKPGGSAYSLLKKYRSVLDNKAKIITADRDVVRRYSKTFTTTGNKIIVPKQKGARINLPKGAATIRKTRTIIPGERPKRMLVKPAIRTFDDIPRGRGYRYVVHIGEHTQLFDSYRQLMDFLTNRYDPREPSQRFNRGFIEVVLPDEKASDYGWEGDDE
jgi:hypothetical protein